VLYTEAPRLYQTHTVPEVAAILGADVGSVQRVLREQGAIGATAARRLIGAGLSVGEIAAEWGVSQGTVTAYLANAARKEKIYGRCDECHEDIHGPHAIVVVGEQEGDDVYECWCAACVQKRGLLVERWEAPLRYSSREAER
jgi:predicted transcriptional regulator